MSGGPSGGVVKADCLRPGHRVWDGSRSGKVVESVKQGGAGPHMRTILWDYGGKSTVSRDKLFGLMESSSPDREGAE